MTSGQLIEDRTDRVDIAARIGAHVVQLLGGDVAGRALLLAERGIVQIRQRGVVRETVIDQHHRAIGAGPHVIRVEIEVDDVLVVQRLHRPA